MSFYLTFTADAKYKSRAVLLVLKAGFLLGLEEINGLLVHAAPKEQLLSEEEKCFYMM